MTVIKNIKWQPYTSSPKTSLKFYESMISHGLPRGHSGREFACQCRRCRFDPWVEKIPGRRKRQPTSIFLPVKPHGQRNLMGYSPWSHKRVGYDLTTKQQQRMLSKIKQSFKDHSAGSLRGELSDGEEVGSAVRLRVRVQVPTLVW